MTLSHRVRRFLLAAGAMIVLWLSWTGLTGGIHQLSQSRTTGQLLQTLTQFSFALFGLLSIVTTVWARRWNGTMLVCWTLSLTCAAALASVVWGNTTLLIGVVSGVAALLIALGIASLLRVGARGLRAREAGASPPHPPA